MRLHDRAKLLPRDAPSQILPVLVVSPLYFAGSIELGVITQSTGAFNNVLNDLSIIVNQACTATPLHCDPCGLLFLATKFDTLLQAARHWWQFESLSSFSAGLGRLSTFVERMESYQIAESKSTFVLNEATLVCRDRIATQWMSAGVVGCYRCWPLA